MSESFKSVDSKFIAMLSGILVLWLILVWQPFANAVIIWVGNDIYNHCLIVIPASLYLIWERRKFLASSGFSYSKIAIVFLIAQLLLYTLGTASDIQLFQHAALFAMLPTIIWMFIGDKLAWEFQFPLIFMLFAIPVGEELIPFLQEITADMSVVMLQWSGIPLFRSGLFIEIPGGKFLVAEACSGVSFLIASIVLGNLYAYMNLVTLKYRFGFVILSVVFPILANAIRVYGIIMIAYWTDMEHAVGADHLIYGWFFFAFVLVCLFIIGEFVKRKEAKTLTVEQEEYYRAKKYDANPDTGKSFSSALFIPVLGLVFMLFALFQDYRMSHAEIVNYDIEEVSFEFEKTTINTIIEWEPIFNQASQTNKLQFNDENDIAFEVYYAVYGDTDGEVISSLNRIYQQENWTLVNRKPISIQDTRVTKEIVASSIGTRKVIYYWYLVDGEVVRTPKEVKLNQAISKLGGIKSTSMFFAVGVDVENPVLIDEVHDEFSSNLDSLLQNSKMIIVK